VLASELPNQRFYMALRNVLVCCTHTHTHPHPHTLSLSLSLSLSPSLSFFLSLTNTHTNVILSQMQSFTHIHTCTHTHAHTHTHYTHTHTQMPSAEIQCGSLFRVVKQRLWSVQRGGGRLRVAWTVHLSCSRYQPPAEAMARTPDPGRRVWSKHNRAYAQRKAGSRTP